MKKYKNAIIAIALILCGFLAWRYYEEQKMLHLHHTYEVSLAKALKNSYKDIEEIHFKNSVYSDKPGDWHTNVSLTFSDETEIEYLVSHSLYMKTNASASIGGKDGSKMMNQLASRRGKTFNKIKVYYSNQKEEDK